jgi:nitrogen fixation NifU-like protein
MLALYHARKFDSIEPSFWTVWQIMSELQELYHEMIIDHGRNPKHFGKMPTANRTAKGFNPFCGDRLTVYLQVHPLTEKVESIQFDGIGCAIAMASASLMAETLTGKTTPEVREVCQLFREQLTLDSPQDKQAIAKLGKLRVLSGVRAFPSRVKCATLAWHTLQTALNQSGMTTTTE